MCIDKNGKHLVKGNYVVIESKDNRINGKMGKVEKTYKDEAYIQIFNYKTLWLFTNELRLIRM